MISAIQLARSGIECRLIERKKYPFHRVCGEYISNEAVPFLKSANLFPEAFNPPVISTLMLSSVQGKYETMPLTLGGFGISRFTYDNFLVEKAKEAGVQVDQNTEVTNVEFLGQSFLVTTSTTTYEAKVVLGAFGKRSKLDVQLNRSFLSKRSPYVGIKYHLYTDHPDHVIALHNFRRGYCGIVNVEAGKTNLCYLTHRDNLKRYKNIHDMEGAVLAENPLLRSVLSSAKILFDKPETINEISFEPKTPVQDHILMVGDAAGMITPLCGNGMAMAIHSAKVASELVIRFVQEPAFNRAALETQYADEWKKRFAKRLWAGRQVQQLFGSSLASALAIHLAIYVKPLARLIIRNTHGETF